MNIDDLTLGQIKQLEKMFLKTKAEPHYLTGKHVLIRTYSAGVHFGVLRSATEDTCILDDAIRIWKWSGAFTLSQLGVDGPQKPEECKFDKPAKSIELQWIEIIECSPKAIDAIKAVKPYKAF